MSATAYTFRRLLTRAVALVALACATFATHHAAAAGERAKADVLCRETAQPLTYSCTIRLSRRRDAAPVSGARIVIKADMPSMPMAHNVPPVTAVESATPGSYQATLVLEMQGSWTLRLEISGPLRDIIVASVDAGHSPGHMSTMGRTEMNGYADPGDAGAVSHGRQVYAHNCAACHGDKLQGELQAGLDVPKGEKPATPLNGSGHSAHHSDADLFTTVKGESADGGQPGPRRMPRFGTTLTDDDVLAVIAYMKSRWPESIRRQHAQMFPHSH